MLGLDPGIHVSLPLTNRKGVDGRDKPGHDVVRGYCINSGGGLRGS